MWLARCHAFDLRSEFRGRQVTCPAVFERHFDVSNAVTALTQSRPSRSEPSVSASPMPSGLTMPIDVSATWRTSGRVLAERRDTGERTRTLTALTPPTQPIAAWPSGIATKNGAVLHGASPRAGVAGFHTLKAP